eukprot:10644063-Alexandrium_andersonii.AAC.1
MSRGERVRKGLGFCAGRLSSGRIWQLLERVLTLAHRGKHVPLDAHRSMGWQIDKKNKKAGPLSVIIIHGMCSFWRAWFKCKYWRHRTWQPPSHAHGSIRHRRREDAMAVQRE